MMVLLFSSELATIPNLIISTASGKHKWATCSKNVPRIPFKRFDTIQKVNGKLMVNYAGHVGMKRKQSLGNEFFQEIQM